MIGYIITLLFGACLVILGWECLRAFAYVMNDTALMVKLKAWRYKRTR